METTTAAVHDDHHPGPRAYVKIAVILAVITLMEVLIYYVDAIKDRRGVFIATLLFFSMMKFVLVALHFMHLKFDSRIFRRLFITGLILAGAVFTIVLAMFGVFTG